MKKLLSCFLFLSQMLMAQDLPKDMGKYDDAGYAIDSTIYNGNKDYINKLFDVDLFLNTFLIKSDDREITKINQGFSKGFKSKFDYGALLIRQVGEGGNYDFIKSYIDEDSNHHLVFRLFSDEGLNYHDYFLKEVDSEVKIVDVYLYLTGENFSTTFSNFYKAAFPADKRKTISFKENQFMKDLIKVNQVKKLIGEGDFKRANKVYQKIDDKTKENKMFKLIGIRIASSLDDEKILLEYIKDYEKAFPNDPSLYLVSIDGAYIRGDYDKVLELIDKLDYALGGDDFLDMYRTNMYYEKGEKASALIYAKNLVKNYPYYIDGHSTLIAILIELKFNNEAIKSLEEFYTTFELTKESMQEAMNEDYPEFVKTKEYKDWIKQK